MKLEEIFGAVMLIEEIIFEIEFLNHQN